MRAKINFVQAYAAPHSLPARQPRCLPSVTPLCSRPQEVLRHGLLRIGTVAVFLPCPSDGISFPHEGGRIYPQSASSSAASAAPESSSSTPPSHPRIGRRARVQTGDFGRAPQHVLCTRVFGARAVAAAARPSSPS
jgi:hypothetical protein